MSETTVIHTGINAGHKAGAAHILDSIGISAVEGTTMREYALHIEPDWLLIYRVTGNVVRFERTGSHSDLFR